VAAALLAERRAEGTKPSDAVIPMQTCDFDTGE
jgi:hypothetical protein